MPRKVARRQDPIWQDVEDWLETSVSSKMAFAAAIGRMDYWPFSVARGPNSRATQRAEFLRSFKEFLEEPSLMLL